MCQRPPTPLQLKTKPGKAYALPGFISRAA